ncbi:MAG: hypothetical protein ACTSUE_01265 [Promethearchaeota archaeon]
MADNKLGKTSIILMVVGLGVGFLLGPGLLMNINSWKSTQVPNPTIDGVWKDGDRWSGSSWVFSEYIIADELDETGQNYFYIHLTSEYLYILADLVSDVTGGAGSGEWFSVLIDGDNSSWIFSESSWNAHLGDPGYGNDMLVYDYDSGTFNASLDIDPYGTGGPFSFYTSLNESDVDLAAGFQATINGQTPHRIYELAIAVSSLNEFNASAFKIGFLGYGTLSTIINGEYSAFWGAPTYVYYEFQIFYVIQELAYFPCG